MLKKIALSLALVTTAYFTTLFADTNDNGVINYDYSKAIRLQEEDRKMYPENFNPEETRKQINELKEKCKKGNKVSCFDAEAYKIDIGEITFEELALKIAPKFCLEEDVDDACIYNWYFINYDYKKAYENKHLMRMMEHSCEKFKNINSCYQVIKTNKINGDLPQKEKYVKIYNTLSKFPYRD